VNTAASTSLLQEPAFDLSDFLSRWQRARLSALRSVLDENLTTLNAVEEELLKLVPQEKRDALLKQVFDHSRALGLGVVRYLGLLWERDDIYRVLAASGSPCISGSWQVTEQAHVLRRSGCRTVGELGSFFCDYWREAVDGLVMGVGENERYVRHESLGHGDAGCVDVLFVDGQEQLGTWVKRGSVPNEIQSGLRPICDRMAESKVKVSIEGYSEGVLYYKIESPNDPVCGTGGRLVHESFRREVTRLFPQIGLQDASPLAVYGSGT
jgi:hypothetical protein